MTTKTSSTDAQEELQAAEGDAVLCFTLFQKKGFMDKVEEEQARPAPPDPETATWRTTHPPRDLHPFR